VSGLHRQGSRNLHWLLLSALIIGLAAFMHYKQRLGIDQWYGVAVFLLLSLKLLASTRIRRSKVTAEQVAVARSLRVCTIVPVANEDHEVLRQCFDSIRHQTRRPERVVVVRDGPSSVETIALIDAYVQTFVDDGIECLVLHWDTNLGKRHGLMAGVTSSPRCDIFLCVDSDTVLHDHALERSLVHFADPTVTGLTGLVLALNAKKNLLTRLIDLRYANAFLYERAAYSRLGSVLCACGSLALYRGDVLRKYMDDFLGQTFLGVPATYGDDRRLTNYCLLEGRVIFEAQSLAWTLVPERPWHYLRQQNRWNKSFFRESIWVIQYMGLRKPATWLTLIELSSWVVFTASLLAALVVAPFIAGFGVWGMYLLYIALLGYARSVRYLEASTEHRISGWDRLFGYLIAPLYGIVHVLVLLPLRVFSLATLRDNSWGTRTRIEVSA
jgi:hyaluronan synthase